MNEWTNECINEWINNEWISTISRRSSSSCSSSSSSSSSSSRRSNYNKNTLLSHQFRQTNDSFSVVFLSANIAIKQRGNQPVKDESVFQTQRSREAIHIKLSAGSGPCLNTGSHVYGAPWCDLNEVLGAGNSLLINWNIPSLPVEQAIGYTSCLRYFPLFLLYCILKVRYLTGSNNILISSLWYKDLRSYIPMCI